MKHHVVLFLLTFFTGAILAFVARAALHDPHAGHAAPVAPTAQVSAPPAAADAPAMTDHGAAHGGNGTPNQTTAPSAEPAKPAADAAPVNTVCAICGMKVDPKIPTATYQGRKVGFGCGACPAMFRANPDKYGPAALRNEVVED